MGFARQYHDRPDRAAIEAVLPAVREQLGILNSAVEATGFLVGHQFTFADINLMPMLERIRLAPEGAEAMAAARHLLPITIPMRGARVLSPPPRRRVNGPDARDDEV